MIFKLSVTDHGLKGNCNLLNRPENRLTFNIGEAKVTLRPMDYLKNGDTVTKMKPY
jgi:hypothetical protein